MAIGDALRLVPEDGRHPHWVEVNPIVRLLLGQSGGLSLPSFRVLEPSPGTDYAELTSLNGELLLGGAGASAGAMTMEGALTLKNGAAFRLQNATNTTVGQFAVDAAGNVTTGGTTGSFYLNGNLRFLDTLKRIEGDWSNATVTNRVLFQTSTTNGGTLLSAIPNGTGTGAGFSAYNNSTPASATGLAWFQATSTAVEIRADAPSGGGLPMEFYTGGALRMALSAAGVLTLAGETIPWTPLTGVSLFQSATVASTITRAEYIILGKKAKVRVHLTATAAGTINNDIRIVLPTSGPDLTASNAAHARPVGKAIFTDAGTAFLEGAAVMKTTTTISLQRNGTADVLGSPSDALAIAIGDAFAVDVEIALA